MNFDDEEIEPRLWQMPVHTYFPGWKIPEEKIKQGEYPLETLIWAYQKPVCITGDFWTDFIFEYHAKVVPSERLGQVKYNLLGQATDTEVDIYLDSLMKHIEGKGHDILIYLTFELCDNEIVKGLRKKLWIESERAFYQKIIAEQLGLWE